MKNNIKAMILKATSAGLLIILGALFTPVRAAVPELINFQGKLTDASGKAVTNAVPMVFRLYTSANGAMPSWTETQSVTPDSYGIYSVQLGEVMPLNIDFSAGYWLGITVGTDSEMLPRYRMVPSVYALYALNSSTAATAANLTGLTATISNLNSVTGTLGTAAFTATTAYATAAQGAKADAALPSADFTDGAVTGKLITGYTASTGTITASDSILQSINKLSGNMAANGNGTVTGVTGTAPVVSSGGTAPVISMPAATSLNAGYATAAHISAIEANTSKVTNATHTGDATGATALTVKGINGVALSGLATGILKNTTTTGAPSIAVAGTDYLAPDGDGSGLQGITASQVSGTLVNQATGINGALAIGFNATASGDTANAIGFNATASGDHDTAIGNSTASGSFSTAIGYGVTASGVSSIAIGYNVNNIIGGTIEIGYTDSNKLQIAGGGFNFIGSGITLNDSTPWQTPLTAGVDYLQPSSLGSAAYAATGDFATAAQGSTADTALQPGGDGSGLTGIPSDSSYTGYVYGDGSNLTNLPGGGGAWTESSGTLYPTTSADRVLIGGATGDTTSALQVAGKSHFVGDTLFEPTSFFGGYQVLVPDGAVAFVIGDPVGQLQFSRNQMQSWNPTRTTPQDFNFGVSDGNNFRTTFGDGSFGGYGQTIARTYMTADSTTGIAIASGGRMMIDPAATFADDATSALQVNGNVNIPTGSSYMINGVAIGGGAWTSDSGTLYPTTSADRVLVGGATDDTTSVLQVNGTVKATVGTFYNDTVMGNGPGALTVTVNQHDGAIGAFQNLNDGGDIPFDFRDSTGGLVMNWGVARSDGYPRLFFNSGAPLKLTTFGTGGSGQRMLINLDPASDDLTSTLQVGGSASFAGGLASITSAGVFTGDGSQLINLPSTSQWTSLDSTHISFPGTVDDGIGANVQIEGNLATGNASTGAVYLSDGGNGADSGPFVLFMSNIAGMSQFSVGDGIPSSGAGRGTGIYFGRFNGSWGELAHIDTSGVMTAAGFSGDGSGLKNIPSPFDQSLNTTDSPTFAGLTIGFPITYDSGPGYLSFNGKAYIDSNGGFGGFFYGDGASLTGIPSDPNFTGLVYGDGSGLSGVLTGSISDYATAAQGALADSSLQDPSVFATAAQGALAESALQPTGEGSLLTWDLASPLESLRANLDNYYIRQGGDGSGLTGLTMSQITDFPDLSSYVTGTPWQSEGYLSDGSVFATAAQGALAETALQNQPSTLTIGENYPITISDAGVQTNGGTVYAAVFALNAEHSLTANFYGIFNGDGSGLSGVLTDPAAFATAAQGTAADSAVQPGSLGSAAYAATGDFATAAQGTTADTALQPGGDGSGLSGVPDPSGYSTLFDGTGGNVATAEGLTFTDPRYGPTPVTISAATLFGGDAGNEGVVHYADVAIYLWNGVDSKVGAQNLLNGTAGYVAKAVAVDSIDGLETDPAFTTWVGNKDLGIGWFANQVSIDDALALAESALQPSGDGSGLTGITASQIPGAVVNHGTGAYSLALGYASTASHSSAVAIGFDAHASGDDATAIGDLVNNVTAESTEIGYTDSYKLQISAAGFNFIGSGITLNGSTPWQTPLTAGTDYLTPTGDGSGLKFATAPASASATGTVGQIANDGTYLYLCTAPNTWVKASIATLGFAAW